MTWPPVWVCHHLSSMPATLSYRTNRSTLLTSVVLTVCIVVSFQEITISPATRLRYPPHYGHRAQIAPGTRYHPLTHYFRPHNHRPKQTTINGGGAPRTAPAGAAAASSRLLPPLKRVCYFRMDPKTEIRLSQVDGTLCTHIVMAFVRIDSWGNICLASATDESYLFEVAPFKRQFPGTKVMVSVFNEPEFNGFPKAALSADNRQRFAKSTVEFLRAYNLDGIDLDWEFPNFPTTFVGREHERLGLTKILKSLRSAIVENFYDRQVQQQQQLAQSAQPHMTYQKGGSEREAPVEPYLLTMAVAGQEAVLRASYELRQVANLCDWLNIMSYDYFLFKPYAPFTGPNSPLYSIVEPYVPIVNRLSTAWTLARLLEEDVPRDKIVMGIPTYARAWRLVFRNTQPAPFTLALGEKGGRIGDYLDYREVCDLIRRQDTIVEFDSRARVPYLLADFGYTWVSFENAQSVREKVRFALENQLAGYMTWNLNSDDFIGTAHQSAPPAAPSRHPNGHLSSSLGLAPFPLHRAMLEEATQFAAGAARY